MKLVPIPCPLTHTARCADGTVAVMEIATMKVKSNGDKSRGLVPIYGMASEKEILPSMNHFAWAKLG